MLFQSLIFFFQVDTQHHDKVGEWDSEQHIAQATEILIRFIKEIKVKFPQVDTRAML